MSPTKKRMPPPKTSSDDSSSESESESESDGVPMAPAPAIAESSSESESESDGEPMAPPIVGGLGDDSDEEGTKKDDSDEEGVKQAAAKKRERMEVSNGNGNGKHKGKKLKQTESSKGGGGGGRGEEEDRDRKPLFQRLFTEKDEITLLQGIIDYTANIGNDPFTRIAAFYDYIKLSLQCDATEAQLLYKMKRMRKKYINISNRKGIKAGKEPNFTKHHERVLFDLSKKIWPSIIANNNIVVVVVDNTIKTDLEKKQRDLNIAQLTLFIEQTKLALKQAELALEAARST